MLLLTTLAIDWSVYSLLTLRIVAFYILPPMYIWSAWSAKISSKRFSLRGLINSEAFGLLSFYYISMYIANRSTISFGIYLIMLSAVFLIYTWLFNYDIRRSRRSE